MALTIDELNIQIEAECVKANGAIDSLIAKLKELEGKLNGLGSAGKKTQTALTQVSTGANKAKTSTDKLATSTNKASKSTKSFTDKLTQQISKYHTLVGAFKSVASTMASWFNESNEYIETLNLFNVTMGDAAPAAREYAEAVERAMGIDSKDFMQYQGVFKNLTAGFGVSAEQANIMSQNLTQLSYDMASFFNATTVEESFDKLSSAMSGQVKGLREYGIDTTVASLQEYALSKGIETKVRAMTQAEKSLLRYNYIMEKSTHIQGDMARTIITPANALRVLSSQLTRLKRAFGDIISVLVTQFIPYVQVAVEIFTALAKKVAAFFGFSSEDFEVNTKGLDGVWEDASDEVDDYSESVKAAKKQLMGFDELNIISNPSSSGGADVGGGGGLNGMTPLEYDFLKDLDTSKLDEIKDKVKIILQVVGLISIGVASWKLVGFLTDLTAAIVKAGSLKAILSGIGGKVLMTIGITLAIAGFALETEGIVDAIKNGLDKINFGKILGGGLLGTGGMAAFGAAFATWIDGAFGSSAVSLAITQAGINLGTGTMAATGATLMGGLGATIAGIGMYFTGIYDAVTNGLDWLSGALIALGATIGGGGIATLIGAIVGTSLGPWGTVIGAAVGLVIGLLTDFVIWFWQNYDKIKEWFLDLPGWLQPVISIAASVLSGGIVGIVAGIIVLIKEWDNIVAAVQTAWTAIGDFFVNLWNGISEFFANLGGNISEFATNAWNAVVSVWSTAAEWYYTIVIQPALNFFMALWDGIKVAAEWCWNAIVDFYTPVVEWFAELFGSVYQTVSDIFYNIGVIASGCWEIIKAVWGIVTDWVEVNIITPVSDFFSEMWTSISDWAKKAWEDIKGVYFTVTQWIKDHIITPVANFFSGLWNSISTWAINAWETIKSVYKTVTTWINTTIIQPVSKFFTGLWEGFTESAKKAWEGVKSVFSTVASFFKKIFTDAWNGIVKVFSIAGDIFVDIKDGVVSAFKWVVNNLIRGINTVVSIPFSGINSALSWLRDLKIVGLQPFADLKSINIPQIPLLAEGGIVTEGQMFIAREAGPELVGSIGRKTAVANNDQIVSGIEAGVYRAMVAANSSGGGTQTIRIINEIDGDVVGEKVIKYHNGKVMQTGVSPLLV